MKFLTFLLILPFFVEAQENASIIDQVNWISDYESALETAQMEKQNVFVYFTGSDWCPPCKMLKKDFFETPEFAVISKNFVLLYIDIPRNSNSITKEQLNHNKQLLPKLNKRGVFPLIKIINWQGTVLDELSGYRMNGDVSAYFSLLEKHK